MRSLWRLDSAGLLCVECVDCHALSCAKARNDGDLGGFKKVDSRGGGLSLLESAMIAGLVSVRIL